MEFPRKDVVEISPVITSRGSVPNAPYGYAPDKLNNAAAPPPTYKDDSNDHCNILPPAPRSQIYPPKCGTLNDQPFKKGGLYLTYSPNQKTAGFTEGAPNNANWVRGNDFADKYPQKRLSNAHLHSKEIDVGKVLQTNTLYVANSPFYRRSKPGCSSCSAYDQQRCADKQCTPDSQPTSCTKGNKWYMTYPHQKEYAKSGQPIFYGDSAQEPTLYFGDDDRVIEGFNPIDFDSGSTQLIVIIWAVVLISVFMLLLSFRKRA